VDDRGALVTRIGQSSRDPQTSRPFPLFFFDRALWSSLPPERPPTRTWTARVSAANDPVLAAATRGAELTLAVIAITAAVAVGGLLLTARAVRAEAALAGLRSDFVSTVTHELKTPLALIRLVGDTLAQKRYTSEKTVEDYAKLLSEESSRLTRLIDNLLTYARMDEVGTTYAAEPLELLDLVDVVMERFDPRFAELGFSVAIDVPDDLPKVVADRGATLQVIDNIIDNAIKYASAGRWLGIRARAEPRHVVLEIADHGEGIAEDELPHVFEKFFRSRSAKGGGSGLGLAIARRVVSDQGGRIAMRSAAGQGTTVSLALPVAEES
jgi:two-component system phosphate regulon sensor histidine kinase PhoR